MTANTYLNSTKKNEENRVVHGSHSWAIFNPFSNSFQLIFVYLAEKQTKGNEK